MRFRTTLPFLFFLLISFASSASAQYMYLDSNGDGINTAEDRLNADGVTHVSVWFDTAHDRDGTPVSCNSHTGAPTDNKPLDIFSYGITLEAIGIGASVSWGTYADSLWNFVGRDRSTDTAIFLERALLTAIASKPQGLYKLGSIDVTVVSGAPSLIISTGVFPDSYFTLFGSACPGLWGINSYVLGYDWFDTDGLGAPLPIPAPARVFSKNSRETFRLNSGKPTLCLQIEPVDADYENTSVQLSTLKMISTGTGTLDQILAIGDKTVLGGDRDRNGVEEITACFARADLGALFANVTGRQDVTVTIEAGLTSGGILRGTTTLAVIGDRATPEASVSPNPLNPDATLRFVTERAGPLRIRIFDVGGRLVREVLNQSVAPAGEHSIKINGRNPDGSALASGVYLYRIDTAEKAVTGRFAILK